MRALTGDPSRAAGDHPRASAPSRKRWTRAHAWTFAVPFAAMALWSIRWVADSRAADDGNRAVRALDVGQAAVAPLLGPFLGPFARHWQPCGLGDGHGFLVGVCAVLLGSGLALQLAPLPSGRGASRLRLLAWGAGWTVWFGAAWWSMLHWFG